MGLTRKSKVVALSVGQGLGGIVKLLTLAVLSRILIKEDYAAYRQTILIVTFVAPFLSFGISSGLYYFLPAEKSRFRGRVIEALWFLALMGALFSVLLASGLNRLLADAFSNPQVAGLLLWMTLHLIVFLPASQADPILTVLGRVVPLATYNIFSQLVIGGAVIIPALLYHSAEAPLAGRVLGGAATGLFGIAMILHFLPRDASRPTIGSIKELILFSFPLGLAASVGVLQRQIDKVVVSNLSTPAEFAIYANGAIEIPLLAVVTGAITAVLMVDMRKRVTEGDLLGAAGLFRKTAEKSSYFILPIMMFLMVSGDSFIEMLFSDAYAESVVPFRIYLLILPVRSVVFASILTALGENRFILLRTVSSMIITTIVSVFLVTLWGVNGAAWATVLVTYVWAVPVNFQRITKCIGIAWYKLLPLRDMGRTFLAFIPVCGALMGLNHLSAGFPEILRFLLNGIVFGIYAMWWLNGKVYDYKELVKRFRAMIVKWKSDRIGN